MTLNTIPIICFNGLNKKQVAPTELNGFSLLMLLIDAPTEQKIIVIDFKNNIELIIKKAVP